MKHRYWAKTLLGRLNNRTRDFRKVKETKAICIESKAHVVTGVVHIHTHTHKCDHGLQTVLESVKTP